MLSLPKPPAWVDAALCAQVDPEAWFPGEGATSRAALSICRRCDVRSECLDYAISNGEHEGIWGGLSARDRRGLGRAA